jgi:hypothetical protein
MKNGNGESRVDVVSIHHDLPNRFQDTDRTSCNLNKNQFVVRTNDDDDGGVFAPLCKPHTCYVPTVTLLQVAISHTRLDSFLLGPYVVCCFTSSDATCGPSQCR